MSDNLFFLQKNSWRINIFAAQIGYGKAVGTTNNFNQFAKKCVAVSSEVDQLKVNPSITGYQHVSVNSLTHDDKSVNSLTHDDKDDKDERSVVIGKVYNCPKNIMIKHKQHQVHSDLTCKIENFLHVVYESIFPVIFRLRSSQRLMPYPTINIQLASVIGKKLKNSDKISKFFDNMIVTTEELQFDDKQCYISAEEASSSDNNISGQSNEQEKKLTKKASQLIVKKLIDEVSISDKQSNQQLTQLQDGVGHLFDINGDIENGDIEESLLKIDSVSNSTSNIHFSKLDLSHSADILMMDQIIDSKNVKHLISSSIKTKDDIKKVNEHLMCCYVDIKFMIVNLGITCHSYCSTKLLSTSSADINQSILLSSIKIFVPVIVKVLSGSTMEDDDWKLIKVLLSVASNFLKNIYWKRVIFYCYSVANYAYKLKEKHVKLLNEYQTTLKMIDDLDKIIIKNSILSKSRESKWSLFSHGFGMSYRDYLLKQVKLKDKLNLCKIELDLCNAKLEQLHKEKMAVVNNDTNYINSAVLCIINRVGVCDHEAEKVHQNLLDLIRLIMLDAGIKLNFKTIFSDFFGKHSSQMTTVLLLVKEIHNKKCSQQQLATPKCQIAGSDEHCVVSQVESSVSR